MCPSITLPTLLWHPLSSAVCPPEFDSYRLSLSPVSITKYAENAPPPPTAAVLWGCHGACRMGGGAMAALVGVLRLFPPPAMGSKFLFLCGFLSPGASFFFSSAESVLSTHWVWGGWGACSYPSQSTIQLCPCFWIETET